MAIEAHFRVVPGGLQCLGPAEASKLEEMNGQEVKAKLTKPRNARFHRLYFAMLKAGIDMADVTLNMEQWRALVICGAGHCDFTTSNAGTLVAVPKSIAWSSMDELSFQQLYQDSISYICQEYLHGTTPDELDSQAQFLAFM